MQSIRTLFTHVHECHATLHHRSRSGNPSTSNAVRVFVGDSTGVIQRDYGPTSPSPRSGSRLVSARHTNSIRPSAGSQNLACTRPVDAYLSASRRWHLCCSFTGAAQRTLIGLTLRSLGRKVPHE